MGTIRLLDDNAYISSELPPLQGELFYLRTLGITLSQTSRPMSSRHYIHMASRRRRYYLDVRNLLFPFIRLPTTVHRSYTISHIPSTFRMYSKIQIPLQRSLVRARTTARCYTQRATVSKKHRNSKQPPPQLNICYKPDKDTSHQQIRMNTTSFA